MLGKIVDGKIKLCPRNGFIGTAAVSNLPEYLAQYPEVAQSEGWKPIVFLDEPPSNPIYIEENDAIYEREADL